MKFLLFLALLWLAGNGFSQKINDEKAFIAGEYDRNMMAENRVLAVDITTYMGEQKVGTRSFSFDTNGQLTSMVYTNGQDETTGIHHFTFDSHNGLKQRITMNLATEKNDTVNYYRVYKGSQLMSESNSEDGFIITYTYDERGRLAEKVIENNSGLVGKMARNYYYMYHDDETMAEVKTYFTSEISNRMPVLKSHKVMAYNEKGWLMAENEKEMNDETGSIVYAYDTTGRCIKVAKEKAETISYTYDSKGLLLKKTTLMKESDMEFTMIHAFSYRYYDKED